MAESCHKKVKVLPSWHEGGANTMWQPPRPGISSGPARGLCRALAERAVEWLREWGYQSLFRDKR